MRWRWAHIGEDSLVGWDHIGEGSLGGGGVSLGEEKISAALGRHRLLALSHFFASPRPGGAVGRWWAVDAVGGGRGRRRACVARTCED